MNFIICVFLLSSAFSDEPKNATSTVETTTAKPTVKTTVATEQVTTTVKTTTTTLKLRPLEIKIDGVEKVLLPKNEATLTARVGFGPGFLII